ncbi:MAG TPA: helix-turn-helix domain-containing protein [Candidatus Limnocylindrales bacterium]|jgi:predicted ArsR family transcriptional regulator|nr:helix-turn-helix domain-containing protein [Candidatus Limnocylindrales bacterium]
MLPDRDDIRAVAMLDEDVRRALYEAVIRSGRALSRDEAAAAVGVSRALAAFHLDRLVEAGLLTPEFRRLSGRTGPGAGRPAKLYRRAERDVVVTLPERRYELAAELFATALDAAGSALPPERLREAARDLGHVEAGEAGEAGGAEDVGEAREAGETGEGPGQATPDADPERARDRLMAALQAQGYQPREAEDGAIRLANCPFHALVEGHEQLVCGMNLALVEGIVERCGGAGYVARPDPQPGWCCVAIESALKSR